jgi:hypothetical protein
MAGAATNAEFIQANQTASAEVATLGEATVSFR